MKSIEENKFLSEFCKEYNIKLPNNLQNIEIYEDIGSFEDAEYIYCIAYEMLIRTDEYCTLLKEYEPLKNKSKDAMTDDEFLKLRKLIDRMNDLGLKKTSFLGFDYDRDKDHVFKRIKYYNEVSNSPRNARMLHELKFDSDEDIFYLLAKFYFEKGKLYTLNCGFHIPLPKNSKELGIDYLKDYSQWKTQEQYTEFYHFLNTYFIPYINKSANKIEYKSLGSNSIYLKDLDKDFLMLLKKKKRSNLLIETKAVYSNNNIGFWYKSYINDIKDGLKKLIAFYRNRNLIYDENIKLIDASLDEILKNPSKFYIPCVDRLTKPIFLPWERSNNLVVDDKFIKELKFNGIKSILGNEGYIRISMEDNIYLMEISKYISLKLLDDSFLKTLTCEDLKNTYIDTEPLFSRPRLMFDEARLTNIPINLNLSKEDLLLYISQIKNDYDRDKKIGRTDIEYLFDLTLKMPSNIKYADEKRDSKDKRILPKKREDFKKSFASAFYIYDLYKFFIQPFEKKKQEIRNQRELKINKIKEIAKKKGVIINQVEIDEVKEVAEIEIKKYENNNLITQISYLVNDLSEEQVEYYLTTMKEFIHGVNLKEENNSLKKMYDSKKTEDPAPKYKNLIIGNSYIIKSNKVDLVKKLID
jgi:hypothetical protein